MREEKLVWGLEGNRESVWKLFRGECYGEVLSWTKWLLRSSEDINEMIVDLVSRVFWIFLVIYEC